MLNVLVDYQLHFSHLFTYCGIALIGCFNAAFLQHCCRFQKLLRFPAAYAVTEAVK